MSTNTSKSQWLNYSGQATDEWSGGIATFSNGDIATAFSVSKSNGSSSVIVQRLNTSGSVVWSLDIGADYAPGAGSVLVGADDKVYVTGGTKQGSTGESGQNDSDIYAVALSPTGQKLWYKNNGIGIHVIGSSAVLDGNGNILLEGRVSEVNDRYSFIKDVSNFYGAEFSGGWRGFQLRINPIDGTVTKAYTTGSGNSGGGPITIDRSRNIAFVAGYTFGAVNGIGTVGNGDPNGANTYLIARNETTGAVLWTRMENWMRSNVVAQDSENAIYFVDKGYLEKVNGSTGQTIWSKALTNTRYTLSPIAGGGVLLAESESNGALTIRRFDASGIETGSQVISHLGTLYPRAFIEQGDGTIIISGSTTGTISVDDETTVGNPKQGGRDSFVLKTNSAFSVPPEVTTPVVRGNSLYTIVDGPSWTQAEANSVKLGGHLVTINNDLENTWIHDTYNLNPWWDRSGDIELFGGLFRESVSSPWMWASGEEVSFTKWSNGEPSNGETELYLALGWSDHYSWNDTYLQPIADGGRPSDSFPYYSLDMYRGIAEIPFIRRGDSAYVIVEGPTWEEAEANANALGGHLVTINDEEENEWILDTYKDYRNTSAPYIVGERKVYIGLNDKNEEGKWEWISGESSSWSPTWAPGMPDNLGNSEDVAEYYLADTQHWRLWKRGEINDVLNGAITGLAEIPLAPNNVPTGTPTLTGDFKAGQTISIDASAIDDTDNFEGWTPTYEYSWEIADDPGLTTMMPIWESLNTADAIDGNKTLEITPDLKGKLIRGVVSYLDGYGTNEVVESVSKLIKQPFDNLIGSVSGKGKLRGTKYVDQFTFNHFESGKNADKIIGYDSSQGDTIAISATVFPSLQDSGVIAFASASTKKELKQLREMNYHIIYFQKKGRLFFNGNGADKGWGDTEEGGLFAILKGKPELTVEDFTLLA